MYKYITDLLFLCNNFCILDKTYIQTKYNIDYNIFDIYFNKHFKDKLIFNSINSEILFICIFNANKNYILKKYNKTIQEVLNKFFIKKKIYFFNKCHKNFNINNYNKMHLNNCKCPIKVKSIVNLKIPVFINILKNSDNFNSNYNNEFNNNNSINSDNTKSFNDDKNNSSSTYINNHKKKYKNNNTDNELIGILNKLSTLKIELDSNKIFNNNINIKKEEYIQNSTEFQLNSEIDLDCTNNDTILENIYEKDIIIENTISEKSKTPEKDIIIENTISEKNKTILNNKYQESEDMYEIDTKNNSIFVDEIKKIKEISKTSNKTSNKTPNNYILYSDDNKKVSISDSNEDSSSSDSESSLDVEEMEKSIVPDSNLKKNKVSFISSQDKYIQNKEAEIKKKKILFLLKNKNKK